MTSAKGGEVGREMRKMLNERKREEEFRDKKREEINYSRKAAFMVSFLVITSCPLQGIFIYTGPWMDPWNYRGTTLTP